MSVAARSPWWYRQRGTVFGIVYGLGFAVSYVSFDGRTPEALGTHRPGVFWTAVACALVAWLLRSCGTAYLRQSVVFADDVQSGTLIVAGPFRYVRNPLYLGNIFLALAVGTLASALGFAIVVIGNAVLVVFLAREEAAEMARRYGATYAAFRAAVPAFVPRLTPANVPGTASVAPAWPPALLGEAFSLAIGLAFVPLALFGNKGFPAFAAITIPACLVIATWNWWAGRAKAPDA